MRISALELSRSQVVGVSLFSSVLFACGSSHPNGQDRGGAAAIGVGSGGDAFGQAGTTSAGAATGGSKAAPAAGGSGTSSNAGTISAGRGGSAGGAAGVGGSRAGAGGASGNAGQAGGASGKGGSGGGGAGSTSDMTVGSGDISSPAKGPAPTDGTKVGGQPFVLVKNWDFGTNGTVRDTNDLVAEFVFHDSFNTIANGTHYGAVIVAPTAATAISASNLGLPGNVQPVEDPAHPNREYTADSLKAHVRPLSASQTTVSAPSHTAGNGSFTSKWKLAKAGSLLGQDLLWETRVRFPTPGKAYWFALWCAGNKWNGGAEMDVVESFGSPNIYPPANAFHVDPVGGSGTVSYSSWPNTLDSLGVTAAKRDLTQYHIWTWVYSKDDSYKVYFDGTQVQSGSIHWTNGGSAGGETIDLEFLFDFGWGWVAKSGENQIQGLNAELPASDFPITYEIDYSRVYLR